MEAEPVVPSIEEQKKQLSELIKQKLKVGDTWYLISHDWWSLLEKYIGLDNNSFHNGPYQNPGRVDNSKLFQPTHDGVRLRAGLMEEADYDAVPEEAWSLLKAWYGVVNDQHEVPRKVINSSETSFIEDLRLEVYPIEFNLVVLRSSAPYEPAEKTLAIYSRTTSLDAIVEEVRERVKAGNNNEFRVWVYNENNCEHLKDNLKDSLDIIGIKTGSLVKIEFKPKGSIDGWPMDLEENKKARQPQSNANSGYRPAVSPTTSSLSSTTSSGAAGARRYETRSSGFSPGFDGHEQGMHSSPKDAAAAAIENAGLNGFSNLGNTCFMNSALQCLSNVAPLTLYLLGPKWQQEMNRENPLGTKGHIADTYAGLVRANWTGLSASNNISFVRDFKRAVGYFASQFSGYQQQDSQELLVFLLDGLHEDFNRVLKKPYVPALDYSNQPDEELARLSWEDYKKRNDSEIVDLFHGLYKSKLVCPDCMKVSIKFDPFCYLSLPLPTKHERNYDLYFVPWDVNSPLQRFRIFISTGATVRELLAEAAKTLQIDSGEKLVLTDVYSNRFYKIFKSSEPVNSITEAYSTTYESYYVYELPVPYEDANWFIAPLYVRKGVSDNTNWYSGGPNLVSLPQFVCVPRSELCYLTIYAAVLERMRRLLDATAFDLQRCQWLTNLKPLVNMQLLDKVDPKEITNPESLQKEEDKMSTDSLPDEKSRWTECKKLLSDFLSGLSGNDLKKAIQRPLFHISEVNTFGSTTMRVLTPANVKLFKPSKGNTSTLFSAADTDAYIHSNPVAMVPYLSADIYTDVFDSHFDAHAFVAKENNLPVVKHPSLQTKGAGKKIINIADCLELYSSEERLGANDLWYCPNCKKHVAATKQLSLWNVPPVLILHLKRFQYTRYYRDKLDAMVDFPLTGLDMSKFIADPDGDKEKLLYDLVAVSIHAGGLGGGHYTAYGRNELTGRWYYFDDSCVSPVRNPEDVVTRGAYLLIYVRRSDEKIFHDIQNRMKAAIVDLVTPGAHSAEASASSSQGSSSHSYNLRQRGSSPAAYGHSGSGNMNALYGLSSLASTSSSVSSSKTAKPASPQQTLASSTSVGGLSSPSQKPSQAIPIAGGRTELSPFNVQDGESGPNVMDQVD